MQQQKKVIKASVLYCEAIGVLSFYSNFIYLIYYNGTLMFPSDLIKP